MMMNFLLKRARPTQFRNLLASSTITSPAPVFTPSTFKNFFSTTSFCKTEETTNKASNNCYVANHPTNEAASDTDVFAVIKLSGSQYKVTLGDVLTVNKVPEAVVGETIELDDILLVGTPNQTIVGAPIVPNAKVTLDVEQQKKDKKVIVFKKTRRQGYQRKNGARRHITVLRVSSIEY